MFTDSLECTHIMWTNHMKNVKSTENRCTLEPIFMNRPDQADGLEIKREGMVSNSMQTSEPIDTTWKL